MIELRAFECRSCGYLLFVPEGAEDPLWCPYCRSGMVEIQVEPPENLQEVICPECEYRFFIRPGAPLYKCPACNFTFQTTPGRHFDERL